MSDLFTYLKWRGDLTFGNAPLCPPDALALSLLPYIRLESVVPNEVTAEPVRLASAAGQFFLHPVSGDSASAQNNLRFLAELQKSARFAPLRLFGAQKLVSEADGIQFAAISILLPGQAMFVAFEGTDSTLVGWKEDLQMSYDCPVPAQLRAVEYLRAVAAAYPLRRIYVGGHSKGGNLAMYAAVYSGAAYRHRIKAVFNNDGPGFCDDTLSSPEYAELRARIQTYLPESSIVGVLLEHDTNYKIVKSDAAGLMQHDAFSWQIEGADFIYAAERTAFGKRTEAIIDRFLTDLSADRKRQFVETLFSILEQANLRSFADLGGNKLKLMRDLYRAYSGLSPDVREMLGDSLGALAEYGKTKKRSS